MDTNQPSNQIKYPPRAGLQPFLNRYFAHRGLHDLASGTPENSLPAFAAARSCQYGVELDVQLSKEGEVVVFHDNNLERLCGMEKQVCELYFEDLKELSLAGTTATICSFEEVLRLFENTSLPIIVEIKSGCRNDELCKKTWNLLQQYSVIFCVESFDPRIINWFRKNAPEVIRGQLSGDDSAFPSSTSRLLCLLLSNCFFNFLTKPDFIAYKIGPRTKRVQKYKKHGMPFIGWTSRAFGEGLKENDSLIFENYRPPVNKAPC